MTRLSSVTVAFLCAGLAAASPVRAQTDTGRGMVFVNGGYQLTGDDFANASTFRANVEDGSVSTRYEVKGGATFDIGAGVRVWRRLALGVGVTRFSNTTTSSLNGTVPHPFYFNRPRPVTGEAVGLKRDELAVHVQAQLLAPLGSRTQLTLFGGPSFFHVGQDLVTSFTWSDSYPFDDAAFNAATASEAKGSSIGFHAGADVAYFFTRSVGIGGVLQFSHATIGLNLADSGPDLKVGGTKAGGGLRVRF